MTEETLFHKALARYLGTFAYDPATLILFKFASTSGINLWT
jgi:hypothetical protein